MVFCFSSAEIIIIITSATRRWTSGLPQDIYQVTLAHVVDFGMLSVLGTLTFLMHTEAKFGKSKTDPRFFQNFGWFPV